MIKKLLPYFLISCTFVLANSRFQTTVAGFGRFNIFDVRRFIGYSNFELMMIIISGVIFLIYHKKKMLKSNRSLFLLFGSMLIISVLSVIIFSSNIASGVRTTLVYLRPFIYFLLFSSIEWQEINIKGILKFMGTIFYINLVIAYYQWLVLGYVIDDLHALMDDAVTFACLMYFGALFYITKFWMTKERKYLLLFLVPLIPALVALTDKATIMLIPTLLVSYLIYKNISVSQMSKIVYAPAFLAGYLTSKRISIKKVLKINAFCLVVIFVVFIQFAQSAKDESRLDIMGDLGRLTELSGMDLTDVVQSIGIFMAYSNIFKIYSENLYSPLLGVGPANYGSVENSLENSESPFSSMVYQEQLEGNYFLGTGGLSVATTDMAVLFIEFGGVFAIIYILFLKRLLDITRSFKSEELNPSFRAIMFWLFSSIVFLIFLGLITAYDGIVRMSNTLPYFMLLGILDSRLQKARV